MTVADKTILYTGAAGGLGAETTLQFLRAGARVVAVDNDRRKIDHLAGEAERAGLKFAGAFGFGKDYARTLREWLVRMQAQESAIKALGHDQQFLRNWEFYLGICAATFEVARTDVVQVELVNA